MTTPSELPADLDRQDPEGEIRARAEAYRNWGRWGDDDVLGTLNFIDDAKRAAAAGLVRDGIAVSLAQSFDMNGPQKGWRRRTNPVHTMLDTGTDAERGNQGFPHGLGGADDVIAMPLQCSTQWDGLGHIFDHGYAWNGRRAGEVVTSDGDLVTGIEHAASVIVSRGVLLDVGRHLYPDTGELPDGYAITAADLRSCVEAQGPRAQVGTGDIVLVRTGQYARARRDGWGDYAGGPAPGSVLDDRRMAARHRDRCDRHRHVGLRGAAERVRRSRVPAAAPGRHPEHRSYDRGDVGPRAARDDLREARSLRVPALRAAAADHLRRRLADQPDRDALGGRHSAERVSQQEQRGSDMTAVKKVAIAGSGVAGLATAIQLAKAGVDVDVFESKPELSALGSGITLQGNALRAFGALGVWDDVQEKGYFFEGLTIRAPGPDAPAVAELPDVKTGGPEFPRDRRNVPPGPRPHPARARAGRGRERAVRREGHRGHRVGWRVSRWRSTANPPASTTCSSARTDSTRRCAT